MRSTTPSIKKDHIPPPSINTNKLNQRHIKKEDYLTRVKRYRLESLSSIYKLTTDGLELCFIVIYVILSFLVIITSIFKHLHFMMIVVSFLYSIVCYIFQPFRSTNVYVLSVLMIYWYVTCYGYYELYNHNHNDFVLIEFCISVLYILISISTWISSIVMTNSRLKKLCVVVIILNAVPLKMSNMYQSFSISMVRVIITIVLFCLFSTRYRMTNITGNNSHMKIYINIHYILFGYIYLVLPFACLMIIKEIHHIKDELTDENGFIMSPFDSEFNNISSFVGKNHEQLHSNNDLINDDSNEEDEYNEDILDENINDNTDYNDDQYFVDVNHLHNELTEHV